MPIQNNLEENHHSALIELLSEINDLVMVDQAVFHITQLTKIYAYRHCCKTY